MLDQITQTFLSKPYIGLSIDNFDHNGSVCYVARMLKLNANYIANHSLGFLIGFHLGSTQAVGLLVEFLNQPRISSEFNVHSSFFCLSILIPVMNFFYKKMVQM